MKSRVEELRTLLMKETEACGGRLPFCRFMALTLYHPKYGYYMTDRARVGPSGDFVTAPEVSSLFGEMLALQFVEVWEALGSPEAPGSFRLIECGGGTGQLAVDIITTLSKKFSRLKRALSYEIIEISHDFRKRQRALLKNAGIDPKSFVRWHAGLEDLEAQEGVESIEGIIFSNELLDAMPVHWVKMAEEGLREVAVVSYNGGIDWSTVLMPVAPPLREDYFALRNIVLERGAYAEIGLEAQSWIERAAKLLKRGVLLTIDYGDPDREQYHPARPMGTLVGHKNHQRVENPLLTPGEMDLTAHVDFSAIASAGASHGLTTVGWTTQGWFLMSLGILHRLSLAVKAIELEEGENSERSVRLRHAVGRLVMPDAMGERFKVLAQTRGLEGVTLSGFEWNNQQNRL